MIFGTSSQLLKAYSSFSLLSSIYLLIIESDPPRIICDCVDEASDAQGYYRLTEINNGTLAAPPLVNGEFYPRPTEPGFSFRFSSPINQLYTVYTFKGKLEVCRYSRQPNAHAVTDWAWDTLDRLRRCEVPASPSRQIELLKTRLLLAEQKLQLFEEYNTDILYDFDQVAAAMKIYRKPPFGASYLKQWLANKKNPLLCPLQKRQANPTVH